MPGFDDAFPQLFARSYAVAHAVLADRGDAEDVAQEALARAYLQWSKLEDGPEPWVVRVTSNLAIDRLRKRARADRRAERVQRSAHAPDPGDTRRVDLERALRRLSSRQREVVVLRYLGGLPEADVAALLGCSPGTVKQHASRGLAGLRKTLGEVAGA